jgi:hypothetical protein
MSATSAEGTTVNVAFTTNAQGQVTIDRDLLLTPQPALKITAAGFLERNTLIRNTADVSFTLWPTANASGLDETLTSTLVYSPSTCPAVNSGLSLMRRLGTATKRVTVTFGPTLQDASAQATHVLALQRLNQASGGTNAYTFVSETTAEDTVVFIADLNPNAATCTAGPEPLRASTSYTLVNGEISGGRLTYCTVDAARNLPLVLHEIGHTYGMNHSPLQSDVMYCTSGRPSLFSVREQLAMKLMRQRRSGNRFPDDDRLTTTALATAPGAVTIECGGWPGMN